jgi:hypothetical protein
MKITFHDHVCKCLPHACPLHIFLTHPVQNAKKHVLPENTNKKCGRTAGIAYKIAYNKNIK